MTRPKVDPEKRQRTATACDSCKKRKQKCNGFLPCNTCTKRNTFCEYSPSGSSNDDLHSPKRRMTDTPSLTRSAEANAQTSYFHAPRATHWASKHVNGIPRSSSARLQEARKQSDVSDFKFPPLSKDMFPGGDQSSKKRELDDSHDTASQIASKTSSLIGEENEDLAPNPRISMRMLQDGKGRLLYLGDSATLSFLQLIRMIVETTAGTSPFTQDPERFSIVERKSGLPANHVNTHILPDRGTANILVDSFLINTNGLMEVFHRENFLRDLDSCYEDPLAVEADWLCLINLTFAIGLVLATPEPGTSEDDLIKRLRAESVDRSEVFYSNAKHLSDPSSGFEDAGFRSIQALALMSLYTLATSRRNASYTYHGMAVRSAFALGLHREETLSFSLFTESEQAERRNLWRTLYVMDRFLSTSLGRPTAICESDCSGEVLDIASMKSFPQTPYPEGVNLKAAPGLAASVRSCHIIGVILDKIYSQRKVSPKLAERIADECKGWPRALDESLNEKEASPNDPSQGIAILHVNLFFHHSIVLLTRPFFLFLMEHKDKPFHSKKGRQTDYAAKMGKFADRCVTSSCDSIKLLQKAREGGYLPRSNPFAMYFLFASAVVVLASEFSDLHRNENATECIKASIEIMEYSAETDPQGTRLLFILHAFRDVVVNLRKDAAKAANESAQQHNKPSNAFISPPDTAATVTPPAGVSTRNNSIISTTSTLLSPLPSAINRNPSVTFAPSVTFSSPPSAPSTRHNSINPSDPMFDLARPVSTNSNNQNPDSSDGADNDSFEFEQLYDPAWDNSGGLVGGLASGPAFMPQINGTSGGAMSFGGAPAVPLFGDAKQDQSQGVVFGGN